MKSSARARFASIRAREFHIHARHCQHGFRRMNGIHTADSAPRRNSDGEKLGLRPREIDGRQRLPPPVAFWNQLLGNRRDRAALHSRITGDAGARNRLMLAHQVQHNSAVDVPRSFAAGYPDVIQVDFTHGLRLNGDIVRVKNECNGRKRQIWRPLKHMIKCRQSNTFHSFEGSCERMIRRFFVAPPPQKTTQLAFHRRAIFHCSACTICIAVLMCNPAAKAMPAGTGCAARHLRRMVRESRTPSKLFFFRILKARGGVSMPLSSMNVSR